MSLSEVSLFYVLGEDPAQRSFVRAWLLASGVSHRCIHTVEPPAHAGGLSFVLSRAAEVVKAAMSRARSKAKTRVIVMLDADAETVQQRVARLSQCCIEQTPEGLEIVCLLVPKRHIETWVHALQNGGCAGDPSTDESVDYKPKSIEEVRAAASRLARCSQDPQAPASLRLGAQNLRQLQAG